MFRILSFSPKKKKKKELKGFYYITLYIRIGVGVKREEGLDLSAVRLS